MRAKIISLTGDLGSGKSTVSNILCKELGFNYIYTGQIQRKIAERYGMTTNELNIYSETHPEVDQEIDNTFKSLENATNIIVDSRLAWHFIPTSFKVFLKTNIIVSAHRISNDKERINENYKSEKEAALNIVKRKQSEVKRYKKYYGVECMDFTNYDLIIDTTEITPQETADIIKREFALYQSEHKKYKAKAFVSPKNLYPTKSDDNSNEINIRSYNSFDYIIDGHSMVSKELKQNSLISVKYINHPSIVNPDKEIINEWQKKHSFEYLITPN